MTTNYNSKIDLIRVGEKPARQNIGIILQDRSHSNVSLNRSPSSVQISKKASFTSKRNKENLHAGILAAIRSRKNVNSAIQKGHMVVDYCERVEIDLTAGEDTKQTAGFTPEELQQLEYQWQDLVAKQESVEYGIHLITQPLQQLYSNLDNFAHSQFAACSSKLLFLLRRLFAFPHEEIKVLSADLSQQLETAGDEHTDEYAVEVLRKLLEKVDKTDSNMKKWGEGLSGGWRDLLDNTISRHDIESRKEENKTKEILARIEEVELLLAQKGSNQLEFELEVKRIEQLLQLTQEDLVEELRDTFTGQVNCLKKSLLQKATAESNRVKAAISDFPGEFCSFMEGKHSFLRQKLQKELEDLDLEPNEGLSSFLFTLDSLMQAIEGQHSPTDFSIDLVRHTKDVFSCFLPSLCSYLDTIFEMHFDYLSFATLSSALPIIRMLSHFILMLIQHRNFVQIMTILHDHITPCEAPKPKQTSALRKLQELEKQHFAHLDEDHFPSALRQPTALDTVEDCDGSPISKDTFEYPLAAHEQAAQGQVSDPPAKPKLHKASSKYSEKKETHNVSVNSLEFQFIVLSLLLVRDRTKKECLIRPLTNLQASIPPCTVPQNPLLPISLESIATELKRIYQKITETSSRKQKIVDEILSLEAEVKLKQQELSRIEVEVRLVKDILSEQKQKKSNPKPADPPQRKTLYKNQAGDRSEKLLSFAVDRSRSKSRTTFANHGSSSLLKKPSEDLTPGLQKPKFSFDRRTETRKSTSPAPRSRNPSRKPWEETGNRHPSRSSNQQTEDPVAELNSLQSSVLETLQLHAKDASSKNPFARKLIKHLSSEYNLEHHSRDWIGLGLAGVLVKKGPKLAVGYSGSKKIDVLSVWKQSTDGKHIDIEKLGFAPRILRLNPESLTFEFIKPSQKRPTLAAFQESSCEVAGSEQLEDFSISVDEVAADDEADEEDLVGAAGQAGRLFGEHVSDRQDRTEALHVLRLGVQLCSFEVFDAGHHRRHPLSPLGAGHRERPGVDQTALTTHQNFKLNFEPPSHLISPRRQIEEGRLS